MATPHLHAYEPATREKCAIVREATWKQPLLLAVMAASAVVENHLFVVYISFMSGPY